MDGGERAGCALQGSLWCLLLASEMPVGPEGKGGGLPALPPCPPSRHSRGVVALGRWGVFADGDICLSCLGQQSGLTAGSCGGGPSHGLVGLGYLHLFVFHICTHHVHFVGP